MVTTVTFEVPGPPQGKARPRFRVARTKAGKQFVNVYTPAKTMAYEKAIAWAAKAAMRGKGLIIGPVELNILAVFGVPASWSTKKRNSALVGYVWPTVKPDWDNIEKVVGDALKGIAWSDDAQVCKTDCRKVYGIEPRLVVQFTGLMTDALPLFGATTAGDSEEPGTRSVAV